MSERLREAIEQDDADWGCEALSDLRKQIDTLDNAPDSPTRSSPSATSTGSDAGKPRTPS